MKTTSSYALSNQMIIFWLGVLTGALIVGFIFLYRAISGVEYSDAVMKAKLKQKLAPYSYVRSAAPSGYGSVTEDQPTPDIGRY